MPLYKSTYDAIGIVMHSNKDCMNIIFYLSMQGFDYDWLHKSFFSIFQRNNNQPFTIFIFKQKKDLCVVCSNKPFKHTLKKIKFIEMFSLNVYRIFYAQEFITLYMNKDLKYIFLLNGIKDSFFKKLKNFYQNLL